MKGIGGERRRGGVHTKPESPVLVRPTRGSVVEVHCRKRQEKRNKSLQLISACLTWAFIFDAYTN